MIPVATFLLLLCWAQTALAIGFWGNGTGSAPTPPPASNVAVGGYYGGFESGSACNLPASFETWLNRPPGSTYWIIFNPGGPASPTNNPSLSTLENQLIFNQCGFGSGRPQQVSVDINDTPTAINAGTYDTYLANLGTALNTEAPNGIVRVMWEFNGSFNYNYVGLNCGGGQNGYTCANYITAFQRYVTKIRANAPNVRFEWTPNICASSSCNPDPAQAYPGDAYVDIIGIDAYDQIDSGNVTNDWNNNFLGNATTGRGLAWQAAFAQAHGKAMSLGETGVGCAHENSNGFNCGTAQLDDAHGAAIENILWPWVKNVASGGNPGNGYVPYLYFDYWDNNTGGYCGLLNGSLSTGGQCPNGVPISPPPQTPPQSFASQYMIPQSAQVFWTDWSIGGSVPAFYVATNGSDANAGTLAAPFATFGKCQTAMQNSGSTKTCYIRSGTYSGFSYASCPPFGLSCVVALDSADSGETWAYYPADGINNAILNGGGSGGVAFGITSNNGNTTNITINGLTIENFASNGIAIYGYNGHSVTGSLIENNIVHDNSQANNTLNSLIEVADNAPSTTIANNYLYNGTYPGIGIHPNATGTFATVGSANLLVKNNIIVHICGGATDCGAIYTDFAEATGEQIINNYCDNPGNNGQNCIYLDDNSSNFTVTGNVTIPGNGGLSCGLIHGGNSNTWKNNLCDVGTANGPAYVFYQLSTPQFAMTGNVWQTNILFGNSAGAIGGNGYYGTSWGPYGNPPNPISISGNMYYNAGGGSITHTGINGAGSDSSPITGTNPTITCWKANIGSPPSGWQTLTQSWGPNGGIDPHSLPGSPTTVTPSWGPSC